MRGVPQVFPAPRFRLQPEKGEKVISNIRIIIKPHFVKYMLETRGFLNSGYFVNLVFLFEDIRDGRKKTIFFGKA